ncbi:uncharacterized protein LOC119189933 [Manduca sexta]|uniref:uncharacterized protein LOC119189933 n=1 Tax=Manduca sexta TaxID=7130 RepID=UPI00188EF22C|nr:uncharacterized protein LOC119189933 [Manduca sexta]
MRTGFPDNGGSSICGDHLRKTAVIDFELHKLNIAIAALQECRLADEGSIREEHYTFFWKGKNASETREHGVGFAIRNDILKSTEGPRGISERIISLRMSTFSGFVTILSVYAPTLTSSTESKDLFYDDLTSTVRQIPSGDRLILLGDFNARVGQDNISWPECLGNHGIGKINENGQRLLEFCALNLLCVTNTYFKGKALHKVSWKHPRSGHWHQLDLILTKRNDLRDIKHTRSFHSADCDTDHSLVVAKMSFVPKKIYKSRTPARKRLDLPKLANKELVAQFNEVTERITRSWNPDTSISEDWTNIQNLLTLTAGEVFGHVQRHQNDWFQTNIEKLKPLIASKNSAALNYRLNPSNSSKEKLRATKAMLQRNTRYCANAYWIELCQSIQECAYTGNISGLYSRIKKAVGPIPKKTAPLKEIDGSVITDRNRQLNRWVEHYTELYSRPVDIDASAVQNFPKLPMMEDLDALPTVTEFHLAVSKLKCEKSPGNDGIPTELLKLECVMPLCYNLLLKCWREGQVPQDMRDANIVTLYKGKGDRGNCNSYRGISLLSIVGKLFARVILGKLQKLADRIYPEAQCGFRAHRSTTDMIFTLRQLQEKCREQRTPLFIAFVDLNKAFDTVSREGLYTALEKMGCPPKLLSLIKSFHQDMNDVHLKHSLYGSESWTSYNKQERKLNNFHMRCLRSILGLTWKDRVTNESVLSTAQLPSIIALLRQRRLRWLGHVHRMAPNRLPRQILLAEVAHAKRPVGRPILRFKDSVKRDMVSFNMDPTKWEEEAVDRVRWRKSVADGVSAHDEAWFKQLAHKREIRRNYAVLPHHTQIQKSAAKTVVVSFGLESV